METDVTVDNDLELFDIIINNHQDDADLVEKFIKEFLSSPSSLNSDGVKRNVSTLQNVMANQSGMDTNVVLDAAIDNSTYLLIFITQTIASDKDRWNTNSMFNSAFITASIEDMSKRWCLIPVWVDGIRDKSQRYRRGIPRLLLNFTGIRYSSTDIKHNEKEWSRLETTLSKKENERKRKLQLWNEKQIRAQEEKSLNYEYQKREEDLLHQQQLERQQRQHVHNMDQISQQSTEPDPTDIKHRTSTQKPTGHRPPPPEHCQHNPVTINITNHVVYDDPLSRVVANQFAPPSPEAETSESSFLSSSQPVIRVNSDTSDTVSSGTTDTTTGTSEISSNNSTRISGQSGSSGDHTSGSTGSQSSSQGVTTVVSPNYTNTGLSPTPPHYHRSVSNRSDPSQDGAGDTRTRLTTASEGEASDPGTGDVPITPNNQDLMPQVPTPVLALTHITEESSSVLSMPPPSYGNHSVPSSMPNADERPIPKPRPKPRRSKMLSCQQNSSEETPSNATYPEMLSRLPSAIKELAFSGDQNDNTTRPVQTVQTSDEPQPLTLHPPGEG